LGQQNPIPSLPGFDGRNKEVKVLVKKTFFISFHQREFSVDGFIGCGENTVGTCEFCGEEDTPRGINDVNVEEVRDGETQVILDPSSEIVMALGKKLRDFLKVGRNLCFRCLPKVSKQMTL